MAQNGATRNQGVKKPAVNKPKNKPPVNGAASKPTPPAPSSARNNAPVSEESMFRRQTIALIIFALGVLVISFAVIEGEKLWLSVHNILYGVFGVTLIPFGVLLLIVAVLLSVNISDRSVKKYTAVGFVALLLVSAVTYLLWNNTDIDSYKTMISDAYKEGSTAIGAGALGALTGGSLCFLLGKTGAVIVSILAVFSFIMTVTQTGLGQLIALITAPFSHAQKGVVKLRERREQRLEEERQYALLHPELSENEVEDDPDLPHGRRRRGEQRRQEERGRGDSAKSRRIPTDFFEEDDHSERGRATTPTDADSDEFEIVSEQVGKPRSDRTADGSLPKDETLDDKLNNLLKAVCGEDEQELSNTQSAESSEEQNGDTDGENGSKADELDLLISNASAQREKPERKTAKQLKADEIRNAAAEFEKEISEKDDPFAEEEEFILPPMELLSETDYSSFKDESAELRAMAEKLIVTLDEYGVKASVSHISRGPTVTRYEIKPAPGVKISRIANLSNDIALRMAAQSVRIEAPIPGKPAVGIEIPNKSRRMVKIRELIESDSFEQAKGELVSVIGKDIEGNIVLCDLSKMPHILIAGSTGSGKSVCVNSMLMSLMYKYTPKEVRMVLVDPKSVEFDVYNGIPHLLVPVVCNAKKAAGVLQWAVSEMQKRYELLKSRNVRSLDAYNSMAEKTGEFDKLSRIIIVIDEMADLMQTTPKEVEDAIARLAAMARAAGMHMVLATQRPSVDVITGTIKNNIPSRIALTVSSQIDSRTILGAGGAESLIGYGDMLYHPMGVNKPKRVQGCFISDAEVQSVINFLKSNSDADYDAEIAEEIERKAAENEDGGDSGSHGVEEDDPVLLKAMEAVVQAGQASASLLQRKLSVGYARAGRLIDQLEERGVVGPYEGSKPRQVLMTQTQWLERSMSVAVPIGTDPSPRPEHVSETPPWEEQNEARESGQGGRNEEQGGQNYRTEQSGQSYRAEQGGQSYRAEQSGQDYRTEQSGQSYRAEQGGQNYRTEQDYSPEDARLIADINSMYDDDEED
ncbi:MAG: DNA translocase FtsK [Oscillospiraceae bacterium]|jgi:S-DNA-T family DNA segregation ATPase FtsK/SpoIIIE|nr:DNA translocase FtsK [Oscillospiraceae bacterium]